jgi:hypothetical protein
MKLFSAIATATFISTLLVAAAPVEAFWGGQKEVNDEQWKGYRECMAAERAIDGNFGYKLRCARDYGIPCETVGMLDLGGGKCRDNSV